MQEFLLFQYIRNVTWEKGVKKGPKCHDFLNGPKYAFSLVAVFEVSPELVFENIQKKRISIFVTEFC